LYDIYFDTALQYNISRKNTFLSTNEL